MSKSKQHWDDVRELRVSPYTQEECEAAYRKKQEEIAWEQYEHMKKQSNK